MTIAELKGKYDNATAKVEKTKKTIERHKKQAEKKLEIIRGKGWDENNQYCKQGTTDHNDAYWTICEYKDKLDDIASATRKLEDNKRIAESWKTKLAEAQEKDNTTVSFPPILKILMQDLEKKWTEYDIEKKEKMLSYRRESDFNTFRKKYSYEEEQKINIENETIVKKNKQDAKIFVIDLYNRVKEKTGNIISWENVHCDGGVLNGTVVGEEGKAKVETIGAGGYNIQKYHLRVLVK